MRRCYCIFVGLFLFVLLHSYFYIIVVAWDMDLDTLLIGRMPDSQLGKMITSAVSKGMNFYALIWENITEKIPGKT